MAAATNFVDVSASLNDFGGIGYEVTMPDTWSWVGDSGRSYLYKVFELPVSFDSRDYGNFVMARRGSSNRWIPVYVGEGDFSKRISPDHYKAHCIEQKGATYAHVHLNLDEHDRRAEVRDLLARFPEAYEPSGCNDA